MKATKIKLRMKERWIESKVLMVINTPPSPEMQV